MVSLERDEARSMTMEESSSSPRISFSADGNGGTNLFISIHPKSPQRHINDPDFEFLSSTQSTFDTNMLSADELFAEGKLLPFWQVQKLNAINLKDDRDLEEGEERKPDAPVAVNGFKDKEEPGRANGWFMDEDPSPRPPNCTVLFKELLRLKKQRKSTATLSPSSSSSSTSSSSSSLGDVAGEKNSNVKRVKKASSLERTRSATIRIRPMVNVPICTAVKTSSNVLPPLFPTRKGRLGR